MTNDRRRWNPFSGWSLRGRVIAVATMVYLISEFGPSINKNIVTSPEIGPAFMAVLAAAITFPEIEKRMRRGSHRNGERRDEIDSGSGHPGRDGDDHEEGHGT